MKPTIPVTPLIPPLRIKRRRTFDDIPPDHHARMAIKMFLLGALVWDYTDTVLDIAAQMRITQVKKLSRTIREVRADYESLRRRSLSAYDIDKEWKLAQLFEGINRPHIQALCRGLLNEIHRDTALDDEYVTLVEAVQIALTLLDALRLYAAKCDDYIRSCYPAPHSILPDHFRRLAVLLPEYAGDSYDSHSQTRALTARILFNEITRIELYGNDSDTVAADSI